MKGLWRNPQTVVCPDCGKYHNHGVRCMECGFEYYMYRRKLYGENHSKKICRECPNCKKLLSAIKTKTSKHKCIKCVWCGYQEKANMFPRVALTKKKYQVIIDGYLKQDSKKKEGVVNGKVKAE